MPAGALASTSALMVLETSMDSIELREAISMVKERAAPEPALEPRRKQQPQPVMLFPLRP